MCYPRPSGGALRCPDPPGLGSPIAGSDSKKTCAGCGSEFVACRRSHRFCSWRCSRESRRRSRFRTCDHCGAAFGCLDPRQRFCSIQCGRKGKHRNSGELAYKWKGGRSRSGGYILVRAPDHPRASAAKPYVFEHILVMEAVLGRHLRLNEHVHHRNGRRSDDRPENLELWRTKDPPGIRSADYHCFGCRCGGLADRGDGSVGVALPPAIERAAQTEPLPPARDGGAVRTGLPDRVPGVCAWCAGDIPSPKIKQRCCSRSCARRFERAYYFGGRAPGWKGGRVRHSAGYVWVWTPTHPRARTTPYVFEHILVMERLLGRYLEPNERIHHRNGRRDDNRPEDLELWRQLTDPSGIRAADYHCPGCECGPRELRGSA